MQYVFVGTVLEMREYLKSQIAKKGLIQEYMRRKKIGFVFVNGELIAWNDNNL